MESISGHFEVAFFAGNSLFEMKSLALLFFLQNKTFKVKLTLVCMGPGGVEGDEEITPTLRKFDSNKNFLTV